MTEFHFTVPTIEFRRALNNLLPFVYADNVLPVLNGIQVELHNGTVTLTATDRYVLGTESIGPADDSTGKLGVVSASGEGSAVISLADAKRLVKTLPKKARGKANAETITLAVTDGRVSVDSATEGLSLTLNEVYGDYPKWGSLIPSEDAEGSVSAIQFNPALLAKFGKVETSTQYATARFTFTTPTKPMRVDIGDTFVGVIMPVRLDA